MSSKDIEFNGDLLQVLKKHKKNVWNAIELFCSLVPSAEISNLQVSEILCCIVELPEGSLAEALRRVLSGEVK